MNRKSEETAEVRFAVYVDGLASVLGHADRVGPLRDYCTGLILPGERKSVEPMAAKTAPARAAAQHQSLLHFVGVASWSDEKVLAKVREMVLPAMERQGPIEAWIIDDTGFPKQGKHSVGVQHQYCGQLGKEANCQVAVSLSIANHSASLPVAYRLYLPKEWSTDRARRNKAGVPRDIRFKTKPEIALEQIRWACESGLPRGVALIDGAYGTDSRLRTGMTALGVSYVVGIQPKILVWPPGTGPKRRGKLLNNTGRRDEPDLISAKRLARDLPQDAWRTIRWREGSAEWLSSRFARVRVRVGHSQLKPELISQEWLLIEWPEGEAEPTKYWLSTLPADIGLRELVDLAKLRWRIERDYLELKQEVGLGHFEGRGWRASIITPRCALQLMDSWSPRGRRFPPQDLVAPRHSRRLRYPKVIDPEDPPLRPERHIANSIATMRVRLINALIKTLPRCPCCGCNPATYRRQKIMTQ
jgi:SRSO17 transposase